MAGDKLPLTNDPLPNIQTNKAGSVVWTLIKDGNSVPMPKDFTKEGGTLALAKTGKYTLTATLTDAAGKQHTASQSITILSIIVPNLTASVEKVHDGETVEIGLTAEGGKPDSVRWALTRDGKEAAVSLEATGGCSPLRLLGTTPSPLSLRTHMGRNFFLSLWQSRYSRTCLYL